MNCHRWMVAGMLAALSGSAAAAGLPGEPALQAFDVLSPPAYHLPLKPMTHRPVDPAKVVAAFIASLEHNTAVPAAVKARVLASLRKTSPTDQPDMLTDALAQLYGDFGKAIEALAMERDDQAARLLKRLADSDDPYLAAHAIYYLARTYLQREDYESAQPLLEQVLGEHLSHTLYGGEALFMLGICHADLLDRQRAAETFKLFIEHYPHASERLRVGAQHMIDELAAIQDGTIIDVADRMDYSRRRLDLERTARLTQRQQEKIIRLLDTLIEQAEQKENSGGGGGGGGGGGRGGQAQGNAQPNSPAQSSSAPVGQARMGDLHRVQRGSASEVWGKARQKEIDKVISSPTSQIPNHYRDLIEQYYRSMQQQPQDTAP